MSKRFLSCAFALVVVAGLSLGAGKEGSWTGWITDTQCGAKGDNANHAACLKKCITEGAK